MHKRLLLFLTLGSIVALNIACSPSQAAGGAAKAPRQVAVQKVSPFNFQKTIKTSGRASAKEEYDLSFKTGGIIANIFVTEGQKVRKGKTLAILQLNEIEAQVEKSKLGQQKAQIDLKNARLALQLAERDMRNVQALYADSVATLEQMENVEVQLENARNQLAAAETATAFSDQDQIVAQYNLQYSKIIAPSNGTILKKMAEPNEIVGPGRPLFLFGTTGQAMVVKVSITDRDIIHVELGDQATVHFDAYPGTAFSAKVKEISAQADPYTGTYELEVELERSTAKILSGFIGSVEIATQKQQPLIRLDAGALVVADGDTGQVFVVENEIAKRREIKIYGLDGEYLLVQSGLAAGEEVVRSGAGYLEDGQVVKVIR